MHPRELLPWRSSTIETSWSPAVACVEIKKRFDPPGSSVGGDAPFVGRAETETTFVLTRRIRQRNSFLPIIHAAVEPSHHGGARIRVRMRLHVLVIVFMSAWIGIATFGSLGAAIPALARGNFSGLTGLALPLVGVLVCCVPFAFEARKAERLLAEIFAPAPGNPAPVPTHEAYR